MEDLLQGVGVVNQARGESTFPIARIDTPYAVATTVEMQALDIDLFTRARVYASTSEYTDYIYDPAKTTGISSDTGTGTWIESAHVHFAANKAAAKSTVYPLGSFVQTLNYHAGSDKGGALYEVKTLIDAGFTPDEFVDFTFDDGKVAVFVEIVPTQFQCGIQEGAVDNAAALQAMFENRFITIIAQNGTVELQSVVNATLTTGKHFVSFGQGRRSIINYTQPSAAINLNVTNQNAFTTLAGIGLTASIDTTAAALTITYPLLAEYYRRQVTLVGLDIVGATASAFAFFDGIVLTNTWLSEVQNCVIQGDPADFARMAGAITFAGTSVGLDVANCQINHMDKGISLLGLSRDLVVDSVRITQVNTGMFANLSSLVGRLVFADSSITAESRGFDLTNLNAVVATGNRINRTITSTVAYYDFDVTNSTGIVINDNLCSEPGTSGIAEFLTFQNVESGSVRANVALDRTTLIRFDASTTRIAGDGNVGDSGSTLLVDAGSGNLIRDAFAP